MLQLNYDAYRMFNMSDEFYMSMGLPTSFVSYNPPSIIEKPTDRTIACHASAWDFCDGSLFKCAKPESISFNNFF